MKKGKDKRKKDKKKHRGLKGILAAMLIALLGLFGFNMGVGDPGEGGNTDSDGGYEQTADDESSNESTDLSSNDDEVVGDNSEVESEQEGEKSTEGLITEEGILTIYLKSDKVYVDESMAESITQDELKELLNQMPEEGQVIIVDKGTITKTLSEVEVMVDELGLSKKLQ